MKKTAAPSIESPTLVNRPLVKFALLILLGVILKLSLVFIAGLILADDTTSTELNPGQWQQNVTGKQNKYQATLSCEAPPKAGTFQQCQIFFTDMKHQAAGVDSVQLEGAMPGHGHGLPTTPVLNAQNRPGTFNIEGLKYNMPGRWLLGFQVNGELGDDQIIFDFTI